MDKDFLIETFNNIIDEVSSSSLITYDSIPEYDLFLSQVTSFLNDKFKEETFTNNIVQNYVKGEVMSKPNDGKKKGYSTNHIIQLILIGYMRPIFTQEEIKKIFTLAFNNIDRSDDDILSWEGAYKAFSSFQSDFIKDFSENAKLDIDSLNELIEKFDVENDDEGKILLFLTIMSLTAQASVITKVVKKLIESYKN